MVYETPKTRILSPLTIASAAIVLLITFPSSAEPVSEGKIEFERLCASCHGFGAKGNGPLAKSLKPPPGDLTKIKQRDGSFSTMKIYQVIYGRGEMVMHGLKQMPTWGLRLSEDTEGSKAHTRITNLVLYLQSIQAP